MAANVPGAIFRYLLHPDGSDRVLYMSPGCYKIWEVTAQKVAKDTRILWEMIHPEDLSGMQASVAESADTLKPWSWAWRITTPSGKVKWLEAAGKPTLQPNGDLIWDSLILDVTDRKRAEETSREQQAQLDLVVQASNIDFYISDLRTQTSYVSPAYKAQLGYPPDAPEACPADWKERLHPDDRERTIAAYRAFMNRKAPYNMDFRLRHRDGSYRWIYSDAQSICDRSGDPVKVVGIHLDITERKQAEKTIQESEARYRLLANNMKDLVCLQEVNGHYLYVSPSCETLLGYRSEEMVGQDSYTFIHPDDRARVAREHRSVQSRQSERLNPITYRVHQKSGDYIWFESLIKPILDDNGRIIRIQTTS